MTRIGKWTTAIVLGLFLAVTGYSIQPAYKGPMGNWEEPAMRPYKWFLRGVKALTFQTVDSIDRGNRKTPGLGMAEGFRGVRKGAFELGESCFKGAMFAPPPPAGDYRKSSSANTFVENDLLLRNVMDYIVACEILSWGLPREAWRWGALIWASQKVIDHYPVVKPLDQEKLAEIAKQKRAAHTRAMIAAEPKTREEIQASYIGERAKINRKDPYRGNIMKLVR